MSPLATIRNYALKLKLHGLSGARLFIKLKLGERKSRDFFANNLRQHRSF